MKNQEIRWADNGDDNDEYIEDEYDYILSRPANEEAPATVEKPELIDAKDYISFDKYFIYFMATVTAGIIFDVIIALLLCSVDVKNISLSVLLVFVALIQIFPQIKKMVINTKDIPIDIIGFGSISLITGLAAGSVACLYDKVSLLVCIELGLLVLFLLFTFAIRGSKKIKELVESDGFDKFAKWVNSAINILSYVFIAILGIIAYYLHYTKNTELFMVVMKYMLIPLAIYIVIICLNSLLNSIVVALKQPFTMDNAIDSALDAYCGLSAFFFFK